MSAPTNTAVSPVPTILPLFLRRPWQAALLAALLALATGLVIEHFAQRFFLEREKISAYEYLSATRARLEGVVNSNLLLVHGLSAVVSAHPDIDQAEFSRIARGLVDERHAVRNIGGAPDLIIRLMYPLEPNRAALGVDYRNHPLQRAVALRAKETGLPVLAGPLTLQQGGQAIIVREPVFLPPAKAGEAPRFWGLISAVIDLKLLYQLAGLASPDPAWQLALRGTDGTGANGAVFFGDARLFAANPVTADVQLPSGSWQIAVMPSAGWGKTDDVIWMIRLMTVLSALTAGWLTYSVGRSARAESKSAAHLRSLIDTIPDTVWMKSPDGIYLSCNPRFEALFGAPEAEIRGKSDYDFIASEQADFFRKNDRIAIDAGRPTVNEEWVTFASDGRRRLLETVKTPVLDEDGVLLGVMGVARDITEHRLAQERIENLNRIYAVLSGINECIVHLRDPDELFREACRIATEVGGFRMAWIGMSERTGAEVRPLASAGAVGDYLDRLYETATAEEWTLGLIGTAYRTGSPVVCNDIASDARMAPWREAALAHGFRALVVLPIRVGSAVRGIFALYTDVTDFFVDAELRLLNELSLDIGFSLEFMQAQAELRQQRDLLKRTSELAGVGGWQFDAATMDGTWTEEMGRIHEITTDHPVALEQVLACMRGAHRARCETALTRAVELAEPFDIELELHTASGKKKWVRTHGVPVQENGKVVRIDGATQDITRHKLAEAKARRSDAVLSSVFQSLPDLFFLLEPDGTVCDYRARQNSDLYLPPELFLGKRLQDTLPLEPATLFGDALAHMGDEMATFEYDLPRGPEIRRFEARLNRLPEGGQVIAVVRDVTSRYRNHIALAESEDRYRQLFLKNPAPMMIYAAASGSLRAVNEEFLDHYGYTQQEAVALNVADLHAPQDHGQLELLLALQRSYDGDWHHVKKDGSQIDVEIHAHDIDYAGQPARICVISDMTVRKQMETEIRQFNAALEARVQTRTAELASANKELETFTYSVSHDLKAPLRGIDGYSVLLEEDRGSTLGDEGRLFVRNIRNGVHQMGQLIEDLLTYSHTDRRSLHNSELDLQVQLDTVLALRQVQLEALGVVIEIDLGSPTVRADPDGLRMVLGNLIDNAIKFQKPGQAPRIEICSARDENGDIISVRDNGIGLDMQFSERIFDIFQRLQRAEDFPGTGIGLAIVRKAMQRMGGQVWVESTPGNGATFFLELPH